MIERFGEALHDVEEDEELQLDDVLSIVTTKAGLVNLRYLSGFLLLTYDGSESEIQAAAEGTRELVEVVLDARSPLVGRRMGRARAKDTYQDAHIVAFRSRPKATAVKVAQSPGRPAS